MGSNNQQIGAVRALVLAEISALEGLPFADKSSPSAGIGSPHLAVVDFGQLGYIMGDSLAPLVPLVSGGSSDSGEDVGQSRGITVQDELLDETNADLHDRLLNLSPPFRLKVNVDGSAAVLNREYGRILRSASFAGAVGTDSPEAEAAIALLFIDAQKSETYETYEGFADQIDGLRMERIEAESRGDLATAKSISDRSDRLIADWLVIGKKREVEAAIRVLNAADEEANFEDQRLRFLELLEARTRHRLSSALTYASVRITPLPALVDPTAMHHWLTVELDNATIRSRVEQVAGLFDLSPETVDEAKTYSAIQFDYVRVSLDREWLADELLAARYWKHADRLSDGQGGGSAPTVVTSAIFLKNVSYTQEFLSITDAAKPPRRAIKKMELSHAVVNTALLTEVTKAMLIKNPTFAFIPPTPPKAQMMLSPSVMKAVARSTTKANFIAAESSKQPPQAVNRPPIFATRMSRFKPKIMSGSSPQVMSRPRPQTTLTLEGQLAIQPEDKATELHLELALLAAGEVIETRTIKLKATSSTNLTFGTKILTAHRDGPVNETVLTVQDTTGNVLLTQLLSMPSKSATRKLSWRLHREPTVFEIVAAALGPHIRLAAYALEVLPTSPNPDPAFDFS